MQVEKYLRQQLINERASSVNTVYLHAYGFNWKNSSDVPETTCNILCQSSIISVSDTSSVYICIQPDLSPILACRSYVYPERPSASWKISNESLQFEILNTENRQNLSRLALLNSRGKVARRSNRPDEALNPSVCFTATTTVIA